MTIEAEVRIGMGMKKAIIGDATYTVLGQDNDGFLVHIAQNTSSNWARVVAKSEGEAISRAARLYLSGNSETSYAKYENR